MKRIGIVLSLASVLTLLVAGPTAAAAPTNDTYGGRVTIGTLPFTDTLDTTEATTDADDAEWNATCGAPATDASVWYEWTASADGVVTASATADFTPGIAVLTGSPGSFSVVWCGPDAVVWEAITSETYLIVVFDDQYDGAGNGGTVTFSLDVAPPPPELSLTVNRTGTFDSATGAALISGTVTCVGEADYTELNVQLQQRVGRFLIRGWGWSSFTCDGTEQPWTAEVYGETGVFKGGKAATVAIGYACGYTSCAEAYVETTVFLRGR